MNWLPFPDKMEETPTTIQMEDIITEPVKRYDKVGGWLLLFCISLVFLSPLITIYNLVSSYQALNMYFDLYPGLKIIGVSDGIMSAMLMLFGISAGVSLWRIVPGAVKTAKIYLMISAGYLVFAAFIPFAVGLPAKFNEAMIPEVVKSSIKGFMYVVIWYSYLNASKRVKETYATNHLENNSGSLDSNLDLLYAKPDLSVTDAYRCIHCGYKKQTETEFCQ